MKKSIALIGFMGTGKTTLGKRLARKLGLEFVDTDQLIEMRQGKKISEIFADEGEAAFRQMERELLGELCARDNLLISTGGGIVLDARNRECLKNNTFLVTLTARPGSIYNRVKNGKNRPLLESDDLYKRIVTMMAKRKKFYAIGHLVVKTDTMSEGKTIAKITEAYEKFCEA
ncbi:MAG: shikimate kinase [Eubacterium sp.]|nr:shikimate kinase [Eubacterium sp.]